MAIFRKSRPESAPAQPPEGAPAHPVRSEPSVASPIAPAIAKNAPAEPTSEDPQLGELVRAMREAAAASLAAGVLATREKAGLPGAVRLWRQAYLQMYGEALPLPPGGAAEKEAADAEDTAGAEPAG